MATSGKRLYGLPEAERLWSDPGQVWESEIEPWFTEGDGPWTIEEFTVHPPIYHAPDADLITERIAEQATDGGELDEAAGDQWYAASEHSAVLAAAEALRQAFAAQITYRMANEKVGTHTLALGADGVWLLDGEPMIVPTTEAAS